MNSLIVYLEEQKKRDSHKTKATFWCQVHQEDDAPDTSPV
jgi:hypothetical protein